MQNEEQERVVVLSGAGISAESGIKTFRDADGLWEGHDVMQVATPEGWRRNQELVLEFYNQRRKQLLEVEPNAAHRALVELEQQYDTHVVTQNIDDLHERAGSSQVIHLHGELLKSRSSRYPDLVYECREDIVLGNKCERGSQLRPHVVWFGEDVPLLRVAAQIITEAHHVIVVGSSMQVYPAAGLVGLAPRDAQIFYIDPKPAINYELAAAPNLKIFPERASTGIRKVVDLLLS